VPQTYIGTKRHNVVRGRFTSATQMDIAVLCSRDGVSTIVVFRGDSASHIAELAASPDAGYLQVIDSDNHVGFSRDISVAAPADIRSHARAHGGAVPAQLEHDGIDDAFAEKGSVVWYWYRGKWLRLQGTD
jgi:hypothetical protein